MTKISSTDRSHYLEKIKPYETVIKTLLAREQTTLQDIKQSNDDSGFQKLVYLADEMIFLASNCLVVGGVSQSMLNIRSEDALNEARKSIYKAVIYLERVVSPLVDAPFAEYEERLAKIAAIDVKSRYDMVKKLGLVLDLLKNAYGENTKWRWAFVEIEGRYAAVAKNALNLKAALANTDPRSPDYEPTVHYLHLVEKLLGEAADRYRERYELSTNHINDLKMGIHFLNALRRIHGIFGERYNAEIIKKKAEIWTVKLEHDMKKQKEAVLKKL